MRRWFLLVALAVASCAPKKPAVVVANVNEQARLVAADALVRVGCFDCLTQAHRDFDSVRALPGVSVAIADRALLGSVRAALLLDLRERELGTTDSGYLQRGRDALAGRDDLLQPLAPLIDGVELISWRFSRLDAGPSELAFRNRLIERQKNRAAVTEQYRSSADQDALSAYYWVAFSCGEGDRDARAPDALLAPLQQWRGAPAIAYRVATCSVAERVALEELLRGEPRFVEIDYWLGVAAIGGLRLEEAESHLRRAYEWRNTWPAVTALLANLYVTAEEFEPALTFYERTLSLAPGHPEATIGRVRSLGLLGRHDDAFQAIDAILNQPSRVFAGEAYYWRAWNGVQVNRLDQAWADVEEATKLWVNSEVAKLAGTIAYRRRVLPVALTRFEEARRISPDDCETQYYLGNIHAELGAWAPTADVFSTTAGCLARARDALRKEIGEIQASSTTAARKKRQIAKREAQIEGAGRMLATSWFNAAVAYFNLGRRNEARPFAERVVDDERFGERARDLLKRLTP